MELRSASSATAFDLRRPWGRGRARQLGSLSEGSSDASYSASSTSPPCEEGGSSSTGRCCHRLSLSTAAMDVITVHHRSSG